MSSTARHASAPLPSGAVSTRAQSHQSGPAVGWRSRMRRQAATRPDGSSAKAPRAAARSEERTSELQSLMRISYAVFCLKKKSTRSKTKTKYNTRHETIERQRNTDQH